jgi:nitroreductase
MSALTAEKRQTEYPAADLFPSRWSPRAMTGEPVTRAELLTLVEAARWAPSSFNNQPWRFYYGLKGGPRWNALLDILVEQNRFWAKNSGALVVVVSKITFDKTGKPSRTHSYDAGAAWAQFALQGTISGLAVHGMEGFDYEKAKKLLQLSDEFQVEAMAAVGRPGKPDGLPEVLRRMEFPSPRKRLAEIAFEG